MSDTGRTLQAAPGAPAADLAALPGDENPAFLHAVLCQLGLPRKPTDQRVFTRTSGSASLRLEAGTWFNGRAWDEQPLPSGTRPRLVLFHVCSEAVRTRSPVVEVEDSVRAFLRRLKIDTAGDSMRRFRKQILSLAVCRMQLGYKTADRVVNLKCDPIEEFEAWLQNDDNGQRSIWPGVMTLSPKFFETLAEHAVPLDQGAIGSLQHSALALDLYTWLAHRLCRIRQSHGVAVPWAALKDQFGQEYACQKAFKREVLAMLRQVRPVYPDARIEQINGGLRLMPSPPPIKRKGVVVALPATVAAVATDAAPPINGKVTARSDPKVALRSVAISKAAVLPQAPLISEDALAAVRTVAPGWDKYFLAARYTEWMKGREHPTNPDAAFLGWAKRFTKGKPA
ncbi:MAG: hypothetical protein K2Z80_12270 [Xanthobacteraceae bacterium]|nr:hypothetical protein [Xanthobacteraceae bacterium]